MFDILIWCFIEPNLKIKFLRADYSCFQIELSKNYGISEWREDLKKVMLDAGLSNTQTVFLFSDTQVTFRRLNENQSRQYMYDDVLILDQK